MKEMHGHIKSLDAQMGVRLDKVHVSDLWSLCKELATLRFDVRSLAENYTPVMPSMIPYFMQPVPRPLP